MEARISNISKEIRPTPKVSATRFDPPPISTGKSLYITRRIRVITPVGTTSVLVSDLQSQLPTTVSAGGFKILKLSIWNMDGNIVSATLGADVWSNDSANSMQYRDIAPLSRLAGISFDIPDSLALVQTSPTGKVLDALESTSKHCIDATVVFQI